MVYRAGFLLLMCFWGVEGWAGELTLKVGAQSGEVKYTGSDPDRQQKVSEPLLDAKLLYISSVQELLDSNLPDWVKESYLTENNIDPSMMTSEELNAGIPVRVYDLDAINSIQNASEPYKTAASGTPREINLHKSAIESEGEDWDSAVESEKEISQFKFCLFDSGEWRNSSKSKNFPISNGTPTADYSNSQYLTGEIGSDFVANGNVYAKLYYAVQSKCGVDYEWVVQGIEVILSSQLAGDISVSGELKKEVNKTLWSKNIRILDGLWSVVYGVVEVDFHYIVDLDLSIDFNASVAADFSIKRNMSGYANLHWWCDTNGDCTQLANESNFAFAEEDASTDAGVAVDISVTPKADLNAEAQLDLYWGVAQVGYVKGGIVAQLPVRFWGYFGTTCSDIDGDGNNDYAEGAIVDLTAELYAYLEASYAFGETKREILKLEVLGFKLFESKYGRNTRISARNLYFNDLLGGSSALKPQVKAFSIIQPNSNLEIKQRSCYPFGEGVEYDVDWGDGRIVRSSGGIVQVPWATYGDHTIRVKAVSDSLGRSINSDWTMRTINVSPNGFRFLPWLTAATSLM